jgi:hypothetical protein
MQGWAGPDRRRRRRESSQPQHIDSVEDLAILAQET